VVGEKAVSIALPILNNCLLTSVVIVFWLMVTVWEQFKTSLFVIEKSLIDHAMSIAHFSCLLQIECALSSLHVVFCSSCKQV
jgi:hypothetical protein